MSKPVFAKDLSIDDVVKYETNADFAFGHMMVVGTNDTAEHPYITLARPYLRRIYDENDIQEHLSGEKTATVYTAYENVIVNRDSSIQSG